MSLCDNCLHLNVCGCEGVCEEALKFCAEFIDKENILDMSKWTLDRINAEQEKHKVGCTTVSIFDKDTFKDLELQSIDNTSNLIDDYIRKLQTEEEMYMICELAKMYVESQRPAKWEYTRNGLIYCNLCNHYLGFKANFCPNCGARMER